MNKAPIAAMLAATLTFGCSTTPVTKETAKQVPPNRVYAPELMQRSPGTATVLFTRDAGFHGSGCTHNVLVNGVKAFAIDQAEYAELYLKPGKYFFGLETGGGLCPNISASQSTELSEGAEETYRILLPSDGSLRLTRTK